MSKHASKQWNIQISETSDTTFKPTPGQVEVIVVASPGEQEQAKTVAYLIAAAPEMLEALLRLLTWDLEHLPEEVSEGYRGIEHDIDKAKRIVAKATDTA